MTRSVKALIFLTHALTC